MVVDILQLTRMRRSISILVAVFLCGLTGCGVFRGIPSHGGGKRFDEEQRIVAAAIRHSVANMNLEELKGRRVQITVESIANDGGGNVYFPGLTHVGGGISGNIGTGNLVQINQSLAAKQSLTNDNYDNSISGNVGFGFSPQTSFASHAMATTADFQYLRAVVEMKALHAGLLLVSADPEAALHVLIDVLGTNRSRTEMLVSSSETLEASCEATYYARNTRTGELLFEARRVAAASAYREIRAIGMKSPIIDRITGRALPTPMPVNSTPSPATQPAQSGTRENWFENVLTKIASD